MILRSLVAAVLLAWSFAAQPEMEKISTLCDKGVCFHWWPILSEVNGWRHDRDASLSLGFNAQIPVGSTFKDADAVIYARAPYKPRMPDIKSVAELIADDRDQFLTETPDIETREIEPISTKDGQKLRSFLFSPKTKGQWERVSYGEEDDFFLVFVVSARTKQALEQAMKGYERFISQYEKTPNPPLQRTPASGRP